MTRSFTVLWTRDRCRLLEEQGEVGTPLEVLFGGAHQSLPKISSFGVARGDYLYPLYCVDKVLYIIARLKVSEIIPIKHYLSDVLKLRKRDKTPDNWWEASRTIDRMSQKKRKELGHRCPYGCVIEAALGEGTPIVFDNAIPATMLQAIRYASPKGERPIKYVENGELKRLNSIHGGVYRLSDESASMFARRVRRAKRTT